MVGGIVAISHATYCWCTSCYILVPKVLNILNGQWWRTGVCIDRNLAYMDSWLSWWEIRIAHWGGIMTSIEKSADGPNTPRTNLAESKHGSWLAGEGFRRRISLYDACTTDLANSILQSSKTISYSIGKHIGKGPSIQRLTERHGS